MIKVSPSILSADFGNLERDIHALKAAGAEYVHIDIMDGHFVPNLSMGFPVVSALRKVTDLVLDVHLMIDRPIRYVERFCDAGADILTVHVEADTEENTLNALKMIKAKGVKPAICVKPKTPAEAVLPFLELCDLVLVMTVEPGFGGQSFIPTTLAKLRELKALAARLGCSPRVEVDGGISAANAREVVAAGADVLVAGSSVFKAADRAKAIADIRAQAALAGAREA